MTQTGLKAFSLFRLIALSIAVGVVLNAFFTANATEDRNLDLNQSVRPSTTIFVNGEQTSALLDTGATIPLIGDRFLEIDRIVDIDQLEGVGVEADSARILGIGGRKFYPITRLSNLSAGGHSWEDLRVAVNTENRFPVQKTVLPISIFETRVVDFDFRNSRVLFYEGRPKRVRHARASSVPYRDVNSLMFVPLKINGVRGHALIDTGADISFLSPEFAEQSGADLDEERTAILRGSDLTNNRASIYRFRRLVFAENEITRITLPVLDTELFSELGFEGEPMMVLGMDLLQHFRVQVDRKRQRIHFVRSTNPLRPSSDRLVSNFANGVSVR